MKNSNESITTKDEQLAKELTERADGGMKISCRGMSRLLGINESSLRGNFKQHPSRQNSPKMAVMLLGHGFDVRDFSQGIPDEAVSKIAQSYADKGNREAVKLLGVFADVGTRVMLRMAKGLSPTVDAKESKPVTLDDAFMALFEANQKAMPVVQERINIQQATSEHGTHAGLGTIIDRIAKSGQPLLGSGEKLTVKQILERYGQKSLARDRGFTVGFGNKLSAAYELVTGRRPEGHSPFVYDMAYSDVILETLSRYELDYTARRQAKLDKFYQAYKAQQTTQEIA